MLTGGEGVLKLKTWFAAIASGGSLVSWSVTFAATTVTVQVSFATKSVSGSSVNVCGPPVTAALCEPLVPHESVNHEPVTSTFSLKVTDTFAVTETSVAPAAGVVLVTVGAASPDVRVWAPSPSKVSVAKPFHSTAGSNASAPFASPVSIVGLRRRVLSAVLVTPVPHSVPGSTPIWPITSSTVAPLRRTTASSPLNQPAPLVWSACARIGAEADAWATT